MTPILCLTVAFATSFNAQADTTARLAGTAKSAFNGRPLAGVMIAVPSARNFAVTDSTGTFLLAGLPPGRQLVRVAYSGRETEDVRFDLRRGKTKRLTVVLDVEAVDLDPVVVETRSPDGWRDLGGFYARRGLYGGFGRFFTREEIERTHVPSIDALLMRTGITTRCVTQGCVPTRLTRGRLCSVAVSVDGFPFWEHDYGQIRIDEVAGVEVYRGMMSPADVFPPLGHDRSCGSVHIWTRG